jgi:uncharacterized protein (TIGR03437 family)
MNTYNHFASVRQVLTLAMGLLSAAAAQTGTLTSVSAASYRPIVAPDSIVAAWGTGLASTTMAASVTDPGPNAALPATLDNVKLQVTMKVQTAVTPTLYLVSPGQINYLLAEDTALGAGTVTVLSDGTVCQGPILVSNVSPAIFTADGSGAGMPAAQILRVNAAGQPVVTSLATPVALTNSPGDQVYLLLYGTGVRYRSLNPVIATAGGVVLPVQYAGPQNQYPGLDQINLGPLPPTLAGMGTVDLVITVDGIPANAVQVAFQ